MSFCFCCWSPYERRTKEFWMIRWKGWITRLAVCSHFLNLECWCTPEHSSAIVLPQQIRNEIKSSPNWPSETFMKFNHDEIYFVSIELTRLSWWELIDLMVSNWWNLCNSSGSNTQLVTLKTPNKLLSNNRSQSFESFDRRKQSDHRRYITIACLCRPLTILLTILFINANPTGAIDRRYWKTTYLLHIKLQQFSRTSPG